MNQTYYLLSNLCTAKGKSSGLIKFPQKETLGIYQTINSTNYDKKIKDNLSFLSVV
jgi:hypothetical protein